MLLWQVFLWGSAFSFRRWDSGEWSLSQHLVDYIYVKMYVYLKINFSYLIIVISPEENSEPKDWLNIRDREKQIFSLSHTFQVLYLPNHLPNHFFSVALVESTNPGIKFICFVFLKYFMSILKIGGQFVWIMKFG